MKLKKLLAVILTVAIISGVLPFGAVTVGAATSGYYTYTVSNGEATITDCDTSIFGNATIPSTFDGYPVTCIGNSAFQGCSSLISINIPNSVTSIGDYAFSFCTELTKIVIPEGVISIGIDSFSYCTSLLEITIPSSIKTIGNYPEYGIPNGTFYNCYSLENVYITNIESWCNIDFKFFYSNPMCYAKKLYLNNELVTSVKIPDGVTKIKTYAFQNLKTLISITIPDSVTSIEHRAFDNCVNLTSITIPNSVTNIGSYVFENCKNLASIIIPDSVASIDSYAFNYCTSLTNVYITNLEKWNNIAFTDSYSNPMYYAKNLYVNNLLLTDLRIPNNTKTINRYTFYNCKSIKNVFIPESLNLIKQNAFYNCSRIENVYYEGSAEEWTEITILSGNDYLQNATIYYNSSSTPDGITSIKISKSPDKVQYIENEEKLDLTGGILTVNYNGGATQDIDLATLNVEGFDNSVLGKQTIIVKYGNHSAEFEVEVIGRLISFIAISLFPNNREYILGETLDLTGGKIAVGYPEGNYEIFDLTADMISNYDMNKSGYQILTVTYKGYTTEFAISIFKNGDINGDDNINATDITLLRLNLLNNYESKTRYDINQDNAFDIRDLIRLKKKLAGIID